MGNTEGIGSERAETRISLVLYGGVSLAVYISGTCQELLSVVRATAGPVARPTRAETVYARLAEHAGEDQKRMKVSVDVVSGSSAGGLNAVFLGKALTQGGTLDRLTEIWRTEADFLRLLNDAESPAPDGIDLPLPTRPTGVLNGDRFFLLLFEALEHMDREAAAEREATGGAPGDGRLVPNVDCFLTATDLRGVAERVQLHRTTITELRHRGRFHFRDGGGTMARPKYDDLGHDTNHLLAFAARATAAFPGAFHPAQWEQAMSLPISREPEALSPGDRFSPNRGPDGDVPVRRRWYSDGGVMDNKPFAYALEPLTNRRADVPVDRRVMYVEPDPNSSVDGWKDNSFPTLDRYTVGTYAMGRAENIREDVAALNVRNEAVNRLNGSVKLLFERRLEDVIDQIKRTTGADDADAAELPNIGLDQRYARDDDGPDPGAGDGIVVSWRNMPPAEHAEKRGWAAVAAESFRWNTVVTDLIVTSLQIGERTPDAALVSKVAEPVRRHIEDWIRSHHPGTKNVARMGLHLFDVAYRLRRFTLLEHLLSHVQRQLNAGESSHDGADHSSHRFAVSSADDRFEQCRAVRSIVNELYLSLRSTVDEQRVVDFQQVLGVDQRDWVDQGPDMAKLLADADFSASLDELITKLEHRLSLPLRQASERGRRAILEAEIDLDLQLRLTDAWLNYGDYDQLILPLAEVANAELDAAEVIRISPLDAPSLVDERPSEGEPGVDGSPARRRKLGGNSLAHFGGFLDKNWRLNDVLWGRLDAAEVIVRSILAHPDEDPVPAVRDVHHAILSDLAEDVARTSLDGSPLWALLEVNANDQSRAHDIARDLLGRCDGLDVTHDTPLSAEHEEVIDATADAFVELLGGDDAHDGTWAVDLSMDNVRSTRGRDKITLLQRGARVAGRVLALAGEAHYEINSGEVAARGKKRTSYELVGSLLVNTVTLAIGGPVRRRVITGILALAGVVGLVLTVSEANRGEDVVAVMACATAAGMVGLVASQMNRSLLRTVFIVLGALGALVGLVAAFAINWLTTSACIVYFTVLGLAATFWFAVGWVRRLLIELGHPKPVQPDD